MKKLIYFVFVMTCVLTGNVVYQKKSKKMKKTLDTYSVLYLY